MKLKEIQKRKDQESTPQRTLPEIESHLEQVILSIKGIDDFVLEH